MIVGPVTFLALAKASDEAGAEFSPLSRLEDVLPVYVELLTALRAAGAEWVQLDEPAQVAKSLPYSDAELASAAERAYAVLTAAAERPSILVAAGYAQLSTEAWTVLAASGVEGIAIDLRRGGQPAAAAGLEDKVLVGGVVDGRNIWRGDLATAFDKLEALKTLGAAQVSAGTTTSLQHVPHDVADETQLDARLVSWLVRRPKGRADRRPWRRDSPRAVPPSPPTSTPPPRPSPTAPPLRASASRPFARAPPPSSTVTSRVATTPSAPPLQDAALGLPLLPTTTIGSFPQTGDIRKARAAHARARSTTPRMRFLKAEIKTVIDLQEDLDIDVLVHGEAERNDMVQYFARLLDGFAVTQNGWVQSYGSRATRPSLLWGDVSRPAPMTVKWAEYAQSAGREARQGNAHRPGHDPRVVVRS